MTRRSRKPGKSRCTKGCYSDNLPDDLLDDLANHTIECTDAEWDKYEQSTLRRLANHIQIGIRGGTVDMTFTKSFA